MAKYDSGWQSNEDSSEPLNSQPAIGLGQQESLSVIQATEGNPVEVTTQGLIFTGDFSRDGNDLLISGNGETLVVEGYFDLIVGQPLVAPNGALLDFSTVSLMAGSASPGEYAQLGAIGTNAEPIGEVIKLDGTATVKHTDGTEKPLLVGEPVFQGDVVNTGDGSDLGISFLDGTVFSLSSNATMVLNELVYNPGESQNNSMLFNLVEGTFVFAAGALAKEGDMKIETPVATMGIRGTTPKATVSQSEGTGVFTVLPDPGSGELGVFYLLDKASGEIIGRVDSDKSNWVLTALNQEPVIIGKSAFDLLEDEQALDAIETAVSIALGQQGELDGSNSFEQVAFNSLSSGNSDGDGNGDDSAETSGDDGGGGDTSSDKDDPPIAGDDAFATNEESVLIGANVIIGDGTNSDFDPDGFELRVVEINGNPLDYGSPDPAPTDVAAPVPPLPSGALLLVNGQGDITYDANDAFDFLGLNDVDVDTFTYTVSDPNGFTDTATVTITITGRNDQPVITQIATTVHEDDFVEFSDTDNTTTTRTALGSVTFLDIDASDTHTADVAAPTVTWDQGGGSLVSLGPIGDLAIVLTESAPDTSPTLELAPDGTVIGIPSDVTGDVAWTYTVQENELDFLGEGETLTIEYPITITDDSGVGAGDATNEQDSVTQIVTITITGSNDQPVITSIDNDAFLTEVAGTGTGTRQLNDTGEIVIRDVDDTDTLLVTEVFNDDMVWSGGTITDQQLTAAQIQALIDDFVLDDFGVALNPEDGSDTITTGWTYETVEDLNFLAAGETLTFSFDIIVTDDSGAANATSTIETVTITISGPSDPNDKPVITGMTATGALTEAAGTDAGTSEEDATGTFTINDLDDTDEVTVDHVYNGDLAWSGGTITTDQLSAADEQALIDGFVLDDFGSSLAIDDTTNSVDSSWTYTTGVDLNFLAEGETLTLSFDVTATDDSGTGTDASDPVTVTITITGTNDQPVITGMTAAGALTEAAGTDAGTSEEDATGTFTINDLDDTDEVTVDHVYNGDLAWSGGTITTDQLSAADEQALIDGFVLDDFGSSLAIDDTTNSVDSSWTYTTGVDLNFLAEGETLTLSFDVTATDDSGTGTDASDPVTVTITITGTNDQPVITGMTAAGALTEAAGTDAGTSEEDATGTFTINDLDDTDEVTVDHVYNGDLAWSGGTITTDQLSAADEQALIDGFVLDDFGSSLAIDDTTNSVDSSWTYTTGVDLNFLAEGETLTLSFDVTATDDSGTGTDASDPVTVTITITGTNDQPVITGMTAAGALTEAAGTDAGTSEEDATGTFTINDLDDTDEVTVDHVYNGDLAWSGGTITTDQLSAADEQALIDGFVLDDFGSSLAIDDTTNSVDSSWTYTTGVDLNFLAEGETLTLSFDVTATDDSGTGTDASDPVTVTITITGTNDDPVVTAETNVTAAIDETDTELTASGSFDIEDVDTTDEVTVTGITVAVSGDDDGAPDNATLAAMLSTQGGIIIDGSNTTGTINWDFDSNGEAFDYLGEEESLVLTYTITIEDDSGGSTTQEVEVTINGTNDDPLIFVDTGDSANATIAESDIGLMASGTLSIEDVDTTDTVDMSIIGAFVLPGTGVTIPAGLTNAVAETFLTLNTANPVIDGVSTTGSQAWDFDSGSEAFDFLGTGESLTIQYIVNAADSSGGSHSHAINVTITGTNDVPEVATSGTPLTYINSGGAQVIDSSLTVSDADANDMIVGATVTISAGFDDTGDLLGFVNQSGITGSYDALSGVLTLTGVATAAEYEAALRSVTFNNTSTSPSGGVKTIEYVVDDGEATSTVATNSVATPMYATINGTTGPDNPLNGTTGDDLINGLAGNDFILADSGDDIILGGDGSDDINGGGGNDVIYGGAGDDTLSGGADADEFVFETNPGADIIMDYDLASGDTVNIAALLDSGFDPNAPENDITFFDDGSSLFMTVDTATGSETIEFGGASYPMAGDFIAIVHDNSLAPIQVQVPTIS